MKKIKLTTKHNRKPKTYSLHTIDSWQELNLKHLLKLANLTTTYSKEHAKTMFFLWINKLKVSKQDPICYAPGKYARVIKRGFKRFVIADLDMAYILRRFEWIYNNQSTPDSKMFHSVFNRIHINDHTLVPPGDSLNNFSYEQFTHVDSHYQNWLQSHNSDDLHKMIVSMYTINGVFNPVENNKFIPLIEDMSDDLKIVHVWFYVGSRKVLAYIFENLFNQSDSDTKTKSDPFLAWMKLTSGMIQTPADLEITKKQLIWDVFSYLDEKIDAYNKQKAKLKNK